jgi:iron(III) transport system permease protein
MTQLNPTAMMEPPPEPAQPKGRSGLWRRWQEIRLIGQDPVLALGLLLVGLFVFVFIAFPLFQMIWQGFFDQRTGDFNIRYFQQYLDPYYQGHNLRVLRNTLTMGFFTALGGTALGFVFAYTLVRCNVPFPRLFHVLTLLPTISPPFAIAIATILLFGRAGLVTREVLGIRFTQGMNDIYGLDGLIFVQTITFFSVAYLIIRAMLERLDPAMEEAALNLGASKFHIFRTITLPLLVPGLAGSFLLLFVESLADLGNPLLLSGAAPVLSTEIYLAVAGEFNQQKAAALSLVLLIPTLTVFLVQRYIVSRRSYVAVTGKPTGGQLMVKEPWIRWTFITITGLVLLLVIGLYLSILVGSFTTLWGINYTLNTTHYLTAFTRGLNAILSTTFLSIVATPIAGLVGMVVAYMVVRKTFSGKQSLDFISNLGGAVPGTILGIGYIVAFINAPMIVVGIVYALLAAYLAGNTVRGWPKRVAVIAVGTLLGYGMNWAPYYLGLDTNGWRSLLMGILLATALLGSFFTLTGRRRVFLITVGSMAAFLFIVNLSPEFTTPLARWGRSLENLFLSRTITKAAGAIRVFTEPTPAIIGFTFLMIAVFAAAQVKETMRGVIAALLLIPSAALIFFGSPLALVGTPYIVIAAYAVRSLPASVRAGVAALQQIDPSIEEASTNLGADASYTFRNVTLPLILPAFIAGLIFAFARHMTSLSAIIFLTTAEWPILTVWILSEVEQGGMSTAAAYSVILVAIVLVAIGFLYAFLGKTMGRGADVDLSL